MFGCPLRPDARSDIAFAMIMLIELSSFGSDGGLDVEEEPNQVCADGRGQDKKPGKHFVARPFTKIHGGKLRLIPDPLNF